jgi:hypothetical protein
MQSKLNFKNLYKTGLLGMFLFLPFWGLLFKIAFFITLLSSILILNIESLKKIYTNKLNIIFTLLYITLLISILYSDNLNYAFKVLNRSSYFLIMPLILGTNIEMSYVFKQKLIKVFVFSCIFSSVICFLNASYNTYIYASVNPFNKSNGNFFSYFNLTSILGQHPIYYGMNLLICISILFQSILKKGDKYKIKTLALISFIITIFFLNSLLLISLTFIIFIINIYLSIKNKIRVKTTMILSVLTLFSIIGSSHFIIQKMNGINPRTDFFTTDFSGNDFTAIKARRAKAYCSIKLISDNVFCGVGIGDGNDELIKYFKKYNFTFGVKQQYNSHNQFLTTSIYTGIIGFLLLLLLFYHLFSKSIRDKNYYLLITTTVFFMFCITESVFERELGVVLFVFFTSFFYNNNLKYKL